MLEPDGILEFTIELKYETSAAALAVELAELFRRILTVMLYKKNKQHTRKVNDRCLTVALDFETQVPSGNLISLALSQLLGL